MKIEKEDFDQWLGHPVTEEVMRMHARLAEKAKQKWVDQTWGGGSVDPLMLADLRARAEVVRDFCELEFEDLEEFLNDEREQNSPDRV